MEIREVQLEIVNEKADKSDKTIIHDDIYEEVEIEKMVITTVKEDMKK